MMDMEKKDHKTIAVARSDPEFNAYHEASQLPPHRLRVLRRFFRDYKRLEKKIVEVEEIAPVEVAYPLIEDALRQYGEHRRIGFES